MTTAPGTAQQTVRRVIVYTLLFILVTISAIGLAGLLGRVLESGTEIANAGSSALASSLAFVVVALPLGAILFRALWRRLAEEPERASVAWGLYVAAMYTVAVITASVTTVETLSGLLEGEWRPSEFAIALVWLGVFVLHRWMLRHPVKGPMRLSTVPLVLSAGFGLAIGVGGLFNFVASLLDSVIRGADNGVIAGTSPLLDLAQALLFAVVGGAVWWMHWKHDEVETLSTGLANVVLVWMGVLGAGLLTLSGLGMVLFIVLRLAFDRSEPIEELVDSLGGAIAAAAIGSLVWRYHWIVARQRGYGALRASALVISGVGMAATASGVGVVINAMLAVLAAVGGTIAGSDTRALLLGGLSALLVGGPVWWLVWKPAAHIDVAQQRDPARRVYLVAVFGLSAVVALIAALTVGYGIFTAVLDSANGSSLIESIRAALGLLIATALVAAYHFSVWRRDRLALAAETPHREAVIGSVILVTDAEAAPLRRLVEELTGASVTVWKRALADGVGAQSAHTATSDAHAEQLALALRGVAAKRVLLVVDVVGGVQVIPLAD